MIQQRQFNVVVPVRQSSPGLYFAQFPVAMTEDRRILISEYENGFLDRPPTVGELLRSDRNFQSIVEWANQTPGCLHFWKDVLSLTGGMVYLLDNFFDEKDLRRLIAIMKYYVQNVRPTRTEFHLLTGIRNFDALKSVYLSEWNQQGDVILRISILPIDKEKSKVGSDIGNHIHDRFALVGGKVWHFGAKVCGMHCGLNALSGPWKDVDHRMEGLMEELSKQSVGIEVYGGNQ